MSWYSGIRMSRYFCRNLHVLCTFLAEIGLINLLVAVGHLQLFFIGKKAFLFCQYALYILVFSICRLILAQVCRSLSSSSGLRSELRLVPSLFSSMLHFKFGCKSCLNSKLELFLQTTGSSPISWYFSELYNIHFENCSPIKICSGVEEEIENCFGA